MVTIVPAAIVFDMHDTHGIPIEITFIAMEKKRAICNLRELVAIAVGHGWNRGRAEQRINTAWRDAYPHTKAAFKEWCNG